MRVKRVIEITSEEENAFGILSDIKCDCDNCNWCPFYHTDPKGSDCLIDLVVRAYREGDIKIKNE